MYSGGTEIISAGGSANGAVFSGGTAIMSTGAIASGTFGFAGDGDLVINQTTGTNVLFGGTVSGLTSSTQILDFANTSFGVNTTVSYANSGGSGTLTVTDGTTSASVNVIGNYTSANFKSAADPGGGTEVFDPPSVPNGGTATPNANTATSNGNTTSSLLPGGGGFNFNPALFMNYAAVLSDGKQFGTWTPGGESDATMAALTSAVSQPMFGGPHR